MFGKEYSKSTEAEIMAAQESVKEKTSVAILLIGADCAWYWKMRNQFLQNVAMGTNYDLKLIDKTINVLNVFAKTIMQVGQNNKSYVKQEQAKVAYSQK